MNAKINIKDSILETNRLVLRPFKRSDLDDFYAYAKVWGVGQMAGWLPHQSIKQSQEILEKFFGVKTSVLWTEQHFFINLDLQIAHQGIQSFKKEAYHGSAKNS